jgi:hypothetical protein
MPLFVASRATLRRAGELDGAAGSEVVTVRQARLTKLCRGPVAVAVHVNDQVNDHGKIRLF